MKNDLTKLVECINSFAFNLFLHLKGKEGNLFYSPFSLFEALAMTYAGAKGQTELNIASALGFNLPQERLHSLFSTVESDLKKRGKWAQGKSEKSFRLNAASAIWAQQGTSFLDSFLDTIRCNYGESIRTVDFKQQTETARSTANKWIEDQTDGKIKEFLSPGTVNELTRLIITNAIYFNVAWAIPFNEKLTSSGIFHSLKDGDVVVPMMHLGKDLKYMERENFQAVELPYSGQEFFMLILLPKAGQYEAFEKAVDINLVKETSINLLETRLDLAIPRFRYESTLDLKDTLSKMGMSIAFSVDEADFSGIDGKRDLYIDKILHKALVSVHEAGTEAAAASGVSFMRSISFRRAVVTIDRPFIFLVCDGQTGSILFTGRVENPSKI